MQTTINTLGNTLSEKIQHPEQRASFLHSISMRLVELCKEHNTWLAGGRIYLTNEHGRPICKDIATNQEAIILWQWEEYILEFDTENRQQRDPWRLPAELSFKIKKKWGEQQKTFFWAQILRTTPEKLAELLSEKSIWIVDVPFEERMKHREKNGQLWSPQKVVFWPRQGKDPYERIHPHLITLIMNSDSREKISYDGDNDLSFIDLDKWDRWYPDFSLIYPWNIIKRHGREYLEVKCWNAQTKRSKEHLLSRPEWFGNFTKHYLQVGSNSFEVMHLVGHTQAQIKFLGWDYRVDVDTSGNIKSKQQRYINLSSSSTFWYDLQDHKKLDHEPA